MKVAFRKTEDAPEEPPGSGDTPETPPSYRYMHCMKKHVPMRDMYSLVPRPKQPQRRSLAVSRGGYCKRSSLGLFGSGNETT